MCSSDPLWLLATAKLKIRPRLRLYLGHVLLMLIVSSSRWTALLFILFACKALLCFACKDHACFLPYFVEPRKYKQTTRIRMDRNGSLLFIRGWSGLRIRRGGFKWMQKNSVDGHLLRVFHPRPWPWCVFIGWGMARGREGAGGGKLNVIPQHEATHAWKKRMKWLARKY